MGWWPGCWGQRAGRQRRPRPRRPVLCLWAPGTPDNGALSTAKRQPLRPWLVWVGSQGSCYQESPPARGDLPHPRNPGQGCTCRPGSTGNPCSLTPGPVRPGSTQTYVRTDRGVTAVLKARQSPWVTLLTKLLCCSHRGYHSPPGPGPLTQPLHSGHVPSCRRPRAPPLQAAPWVSCRVSRSRWADIFL